MEYIYVTENNFLNKQKYNYSKFGGQDFLDAYIKNRHDTLNYLEKKDLRKNKYSYDDLCAILLQISKGGAVDKELCDKYVQKFEVQKCFYKQYDENWRPVIESGYSKLRTYILFAYVLLGMYQCTEGLKYYNCLLKVDDTLISQRDCLSDGEKVLFADILKRELDIYEAILCDVGEGK